MATRLLNFSGITNPSGSHRAFRGGANNLPPASGGTDNITTEVSTTQYGQLASDNGVGAYETTNYNYTGMRFLLRVPNDITLSSISQFVASIKAAGGDGYSLSGWRFYIKNFNTGTWEYVNESLAGAWTTLSVTKNSNIQNYIDGNRDIHLLAISRYPMDGNGAGGYVTVDYPAVTLTYTEDTPAPDFIPPVLILRL